MPGCGSGRRTALALIHYYVHGRGRGHATRTAAVVRGLLEDGHQIRAFSGPDGLPLLREVVETAAIASVPARFSREVPRLLARRVREGLRAGLRDRPDLIVSDGDLPGLLAARRLRCRSVAIGHGLVFRACVRPPGLPTGPWMREAIKAGVSSAGADALVAVNFVPLALRLDRARLSRPALDPDLPAPRPPGDDVVCYFRDGPCLPVLRALAAEGLRVVLFGAEPVAVPGVEVRPIERASFLQCLASARAVVASGGSQLTAECVALGIPLFALYARSDDEQRLNALMLEHASLGSGAAFDDLDPATLRRFLAGPLRHAGPSWRAPDAAATMRDLVAELCRRPR